MPDFSKKPRPPNKDDDDDGDKNLLVVPEAWVEPRCHVCNSKYRRAIDRMVALGTNYSEISRFFGGEVDRRSISSHAKKHLNYEDAAIRRIIEREAAEAQEDAEEGIQGALTRRVYLNAALQKALEGLLRGNTSVEPKDAVQIIQLLDKLDSQTEGAAIDELRLQFNAFVQAIREICAPDEWQKILDRTRELLKLSPTAEIRPAE